MRRTIVSLIVLLSVVAFPSAADAGWRVERATTIARIVWHNPNVDRMQIRWGVPPVDTEDASAWTWVDDGIVWLDSRQQLAWEPFCTLVLHEAGHLAGAPHSAKGIMSPDAVFVEDTTRIHGRTTTVWSGTDPRCRDRGRPFLEAHNSL